ncbi:GntR family transcriptional regulator [Rhodobacteraceae bacterium RKSG542]|uniref:GntR family transcriptional regulator n=1 Tax=Pseudovibrio flavus TaxID=2529854 RepID=UPI0012BD47CC|nr:GntR family transcriptional regulator [Pseudovibrio flavus]MTI16265.1 GntR family transcriptional regulator [Pseudovibrio flavus]
MKEQKKLLREIVYSRLKSRIVIGKLPMGSKLSENSIASELGVSKSPVRDAIQMLERDGLVTVKQQSGTFVVKPSKEQLKEILEHRHAIETACLRYCDRDFLPDLGQELAGIVEQMEFSIEQNNTALFYLLDHQFHEKIVAAAGNRLLVKSYELSNTLMAAILNQYGLSDEYVLKAYKEHQLIANFLINSDLEGAITILDDHLNVERNIYYGYQFKEFLNHVGVNLPDQDKL